VGIDYVLGGIVPKGQKVVALVVCPKGKAFQNFELAAEAGQASGDSLGCGILA